MHCSRDLMHIFPLWSPSWCKKTKKQKKPHRRTVNDKTHLFCSGLEWISVASTLQTCLVANIRSPTNTFIHMLAISIWPSHSEEWSKKRGSKTLHTEAKAQMTAAGFFPLRLSVFINARVALPREWQWLLPLISVLMRRSRNREAAAQLSVNDMSVWHDHTPAGWQLTAAAEGRAC